MELVISTPSTPEEWERYYDLRWRILRAPWGKPKESAKDPTDDQAYHLMACYEPGIPVGVGRINPIDDYTWQIRFMAVEENQQGNGIGKSIVTSLEQYARALNANTVKLNSRINAVNFYKSIGYNIIQEVDALWGIIPHFLMSKNL
jgi:GNAT superfamily N-acetyltransferase